MSMVQDKNLEAQQSRVNLLSILTLMFPAYKIKLGKNIIYL